MTAAKKLQDMSVLLVEDDTEFAASLELILRQHGIRVVIAADGKSAQNLAVDKKFDLVLSDISMPNGGGMELLRFVQSTKKIPMVLMTGFPDSYSAKEAFAQGAKGFLTKPFKQADLLRLIGEIVPDVSKPVEGAEPVKVDAAKETAAATPYGSLYLKEMDLKQFSIAAGLLALAFTEMRQNKQQYAQLVAIRQRSGHSFTHAVAVALYSVLIAKTMGWSSMENIIELAKLGLMNEHGGLTTSSPDEAARFLDVQTLGGMQVLAVATQFCNLVFPEPGRTGIGPKAAIAQLLATNEGRFDEKMLFALSVLV